MVHFQEENQPFLSLHPFLGGVNLTGDNLLHKEQTYSSEASSLLEKIALQVSRAAGTKLFYPRYTPMEDTYNFLLLQQQSDHNPHCMEKTMLVSCDIRFNRRDQKQRRNGEVCQASQTCFWSSLKNLISNYMVFHLLCIL